jgi:hypothetical protein
VRADGQVVTGKVKVTWRGESKTVRLDDGKAVVQLGKWGSVGEKTVKVRYLGSSMANPARAEAIVNVKAPRRR